MVRILTTTLQIGKRKARAALKLAYCSTALFFEYIFFPASRSFLVARVAAYGIRGARSRSSIPMSLYVTSVCGLRCEECIMMGLMDSQKSYQMSMHELQHFIKVSEASGYCFNLILTGGEPTLWKNFESGIKLLRQSSACGTLILFTNAMSIDPVTDEVVACLDRIRVSEYSNNKENIATLQSRFGDKVQVVDRQDFWSNPKEAVPHSLPAQCLNPEILLANYQVYACPHSASIAAANGSLARLSNPLSKHFLAGLFLIKFKQQREVCRHCISNNRVRKQKEKIKNVTQRERRALQILSERECGTACARDETAAPPP